ncbi:MAG: hypothetical protein RLZ14_1033 [Actinomycetota bacterium]
MVCPSCGAPASEHSSACQSCGAALRQTTPAALGWGPPHPATRVEVPWDPPVGRADVVAPIAPTEATSEWAASLVWDAHDAAVVDLTAVDPAGGDLARVDPSGLDLADTPAGGLVWDTLGFDLEPGPVLRQPDVAALPSRRRAMALLTLSVLAAAASVLSAVAAVVGFDVRSEVNGSLSLKANDFSSNSIVGCIIVAVLMVAGAAAAAAGRRFGAGVAGGAAFAAAGLLLWIDGQGLAVLDSITSGLHEKHVSYQLATTLDVGFWTALVAAGLSLAVVAVAWGWRSTDGRAPHHPAIGVFGAFATLVMVAGLMVPVGGAALVDNFTKDRPVNAVRFGKAFVFYLLAIDHQPQPPVTWALRLALMLLLAVAGLVAFLKGTRFSVGIAVGVLPLQLWLWSTSALQAGDRPFSIAGGNPGGSGFESHLVTTVGIMMFVVALVISLVAAFAVRRD